MKQNCEIIEIKENVITLKCVCKFTQTCEYDKFKKLKNWCQHFACKFYYKYTTITNKLLDTWFKFENYSNTIENNTIENNTIYTLTCPNKHIFKTTIRNWKLNKRCIICSYKKFYEDNDCKIDTFKNNKILTYYCKNNHYIQNLYPCHFIKRIEKKLNPCKICEIENWLTNKKCVYIKTEKRRVTFNCKCGKLCIANENNILKENFIGCSTCSNPFNNKEIQQKIKQTNLKKYGVDNPSKCEETKQKIVQTHMNNFGVRNVMQNIDIFKKNKNSSRNTKKKYVFPSGRTEYIQGYENRCIDLLLDKYEEDDIIIDMDIEIYYFNPRKQKICRYYPDIYIKSEDIIIEVKSDFTYTREKDTNISKFLKVISMGFTFQLFVFDKKGKNVYTEIYSPMQLGVCYSFSLL